MITVTKPIHVEKEVEKLAVDTRTAAQMLSVSTRTVTSLAEKGLIKRIKVGWRNLFVVSSIKNYLETSTAD